MRTCIANTSLIHPQGCCKIWICSYTSSSNCVPPNVSIKLVGGKCPCCFSAGKVPCTATALACIEDTYVLLLLDSCESLLDAFGTIVYRIHCFTPNIGVLSSWMVHSIFKMLSEGNTTAQIMGSPFQKASALTWNEHRALVKMFSGYSASAGTSGIGARRKTDSLLFYHIHQQAERATQSPGLRPQPAPMECSVP